MPVGGEVCSTCGNSANIKAPNQLLVGTTTSLWRCWLQLNKDGWCVLASVVNAQSLCGGRLQHQSLPAGCWFLGWRTWRPEEGEEERRFMIKGWFRIYQRKGFQHFLLRFPENAALKMATITDALSGWLKEFPDLNKETRDENLITETYNNSDLPIFSVPMSTLVPFYGSRWTKRALIFCLNGREIFMSANGIFFVAFLVARFSHDGLQETCHIAHACRSVLCGRDPPGGLKK